MNTSTAFQLYLFSISRKLHWKPSPAFLTLRTDQNRDENEGCANWPLLKYLPHFLPFGVLNQSGFWSGKKLVDLLKGSEYPGGT